MKNQAKTKPATAPQIAAEICGVDQVAKSKGSFISAGEYFYSGGKTASQFTAEVAAQLAKYLPDYTATFVAEGDVFKPFKGGASTANSTHWWCRFTVVPKALDVDLPEDTGHTGGAAKRNW